MFCFIPAEEIVELYEKGIIDLHFPEIPPVFINNRLVTSAYNYKQGVIPLAFWFDRFDGQRKMVNAEETNTGIALAVASIDDEGSDHFPAQKSVRIKSHGFSTIFFYQFILLNPYPNPFYVDLFLPD